MLCVPALLATYMSYNILTIVTSTFFPYQTFYSRALILFRINHFYIYHRSRILFKNNVSPSLSLSLFSLSLSLFSLSLYPSRMHTHAHTHTHSFSPYISLVRFILISLLDPVIYFCYYRGRSIWFCKCSG